MDLQILILAPGSRDFGQMLMLYDDCIRQQQLDPEYEREGTIEVPVLERLRGARNTNVTTTALL